LFILLSITSYSQFWDVTIPKKLEGTINSEFDEISPVFSSDSSYLYFIRSFSPENTGGINDQDIWYSEKDNKGIYSKSSPLTSLNNKLNNGVFGISNNGESLYLVDTYQGKKDKKKGCSVAIGKNDSWSKPNHLNIPNLDIEGDAFGFHINNTEDVLIVSYKGMNSIGEEDLYVSKKVNGEWQAVIHMGKDINTNGYEISPFLSKNSDTLFFSSNGLGGLGDADIFYSVRKDESFTNWSSPKNLGNKINSSKFDAYFTYNKTTLFFSSNRDGMNSDIYSSKIISPDPLSGTISSKNVTIIKGQNGSVDITIKGGESPYSYKWNNGSLTEDLANVQKGEYSVIVTDIKGRKLELKATLTEPILKVGSDIATLIALKPIYYDMGKFEIRKDAAQELDKIIKIMNENPEMVVELGSHTDCRSSKDYNQKLSQKRANSAVSYIQKQIKNPKRITGKGYGESKLKINCPCEGKVMPTCPEEDHAKNRRTEFLILSMGK
jgi:outer membrane protein OmpA-like peptidoglycan-associated protein